MTPAIDVVRAATLGFTNLEVNLLDAERARGAETRPAPRWVFGPASQARELRDLGIDLVSLANNHALDFGPEGLTSTRRALDEAGILHAGAGPDLAAARAPAVAGRGARRVALIAVTASASEGSRASRSQQDIQGRPGVSALQYSADVTVDPATYRTLAQSVATLKAGPPPGDREMTMFGTRIRMGDRTHVDFVMNVGDEQEILEQIRAARAEAELVIVSIHAHEPSNASDQPAEFLRQFAHDAVDAGAAIVVGHGPHRMRGLEIYKRALILYSLGNFIYQTDGLDFRAADPFDAGQNLYSIAIGASGDSGLPASQLDSDWWWESVLVVPRVDRGILAGLKIYPLSLRSESDPARQGLPELAKGARATAILRRFSDLSQQLGTELGLGNGAETLDVPIP